MAVYFNGFSWLKDLHRLALPYRAPLPLSDPLYHIIRGFKTAIDLGQAAYFTEEIAEKVHLLSQRKEIYYATVKFGFLIRIFSMLRNYLLLGCMESSADLGLKLSAPFLKAPQEEKVEIALELPKEAEEENGEIIAEPAAIPIVPMIAAPVAVKTLKAKFIGIMERVWLAEEIRKRDEIRYLFDKLMLNPEFAKVEKENENTCSFKLKRGYQGTLRRHGINFQVVIQPDQIFVFSEKNGEKFVNLPLNGIMLRFPFGFFTKDLYLKKIQMVGDKITLHGQESMGFKMSEWWPIEDCVDIWKKILWR